MNPPLSGLTVLVTRPLPQAHALAQTLYDLGAGPVIFPGMEIEPVQDARLASALREIERAEVVVFVSPSAARIGMALVRSAGGLPRRALVAAVGPGTARALSDEGVTRVLMPNEGYDSAALARHPALQAVAGKCIVVFRGEGGREHLLDTLRERGARVVLAQCYRRVRPSGRFADALARWNRDEAVWTATSSEIVDNLFAVAGETGSALLRSKVLFVPHARIAARAFAHGVQRIFVTGPGDAGLVAGLKTWRLGLRDDRN